MNLANILTFSVCLILILSVLDTAAQGRGRGRGRRNRSRSDEGGNSSDSQGGDVSSEETGAGGQRANNRGPGRGRGRGRGSCGGGANRESIDCECLGGSSGRLARNRNEDFIRCSDNEATLTCGCELPRCPDNSTVTCSCGTGEACAAPHDGINLCCNSANQPLKLQNTTCTTCPDGSVPEFD